MRLKKRKLFIESLQNTTRGPAQIRLIFEVKNHFSVRDEDSSEKQKRHSIHKTSRKNQGQIHVLFYIHTCTCIYIVFNRHHIYILKALSACAQLGLGDFQIWGVGFMKYIKMVKLEHSASFKNSLIEMYSKPGDIDDARGVSYQNAIIQGLAFHGLGEGALAQFHQMLYSMVTKAVEGEIIESSGGSRYLSTITLKNFHLFKIAEPVINFCLKKFSN